MLRFPETVQTAAQNLEPHHLPHYAMELATAFHWFYENCRVISANPEDAEVTLARLKLVEAAQVVLRRCLGLMGMGAIAQATGRMALSLVGAQDDTVAEAVEIDQNTLLGIETAEVEAPVREKVCTIRTRKGAETVEVPVPCPTN